MNQESEPRCTMLAEYCRIEETKSSWSRRIARKSMLDDDIPIKSFSDGSFSGFQPPTRRIDQCDDDVT